MIGVYIRGDTLVFEDIEKGNKILTLDIDKDGMLKTYIFPELDRYIVINNKELKYGSLDGKISGTLDIGYSEYFRQVHSITTKRIYFRKTVGNKVFDPSSLEIENIPILREATDYTVSNDDRYIALRRDGNDGVIEIYNNEKNERVNNYEHSGLLLCLSSRYIVTNSDVIDWKNSQVLMNIFPLLPLVFINENIFIATMYDEDLGKSTLFTVDPKSRKVENTGILIHPDLLFSVSDNTVVVYTNEDMFCVIFDTYNFKVVEIERRYQYITFPFPCCQIIQR